MKKSKKMKTTKRLSVLCVAIVLGCGWTACESDLFEGSGKNNSTFTRTDSLEYALQNVVQAFCATDSTLADKLAMNATFEPDYGMALYSVTPTVRYVPTSSADYARELFMSKFFPAIIYSRADTTATDILIDLGSYGKVEFTPSQKDGSVAAIEVDVPAIPNLSQVVFIRPEALPQNGGDGQLAVGNVLRKNKRYWVCIRPANFGGLLVTFDRRDGHPFVGGDGDYDPKPTYVEDPFRIYCRTEETSWYPQNVSSTSYINKGFPGKDQLDCLREFIYDGNGKILQRAIDAFTIAVKNRGGQTLYDNIFKDGIVFCCGEGADYRDGPTRTYDYKKYCTKYIFRKDGWYDFTYDYKTRLCTSSWYIMHPKGAKFFYEQDGEWETKYMPGTWPSESATNTTGFIRTEMKTFTDQTRFYNPDTFEGVEGWELIDY